MKGALGLFALRAQGGSVAWEHRLRVQQQYPTPAPSGEFVDTGRDPGNLVVLETRTGEIVWQRPVLDAQYATGLASENERIYAATANGEGRCVDLASGEVVWTFRAGRDLLDVASGECLGNTQFDAPITAAPCPVEDGFCVGTWDGRLYRFLA